MIEGVRLQTLQLHRDERGHFAEIFRASDHNAPLVQANHSFSKQGALRGLHYHRHQADLWYVVAGKAQVGLVDLRARTDPPRAESFVLNASEPTTLYVPPGVAHGYAAVTDVEVIYFVTAEYDASDEYGLAWNDPALGIRWEIDDPVLSARDASNPALDWAQIPSFA